MRKFVAESAKVSGLYRETPLIRSIDLSYDNVQVFLKLECLQPSGSFKDRGIGHKVKSILDCYVNPKQISKFVSSSGGNAGLAVATAGQRLNVPVHVFVPTSTNPMMIEKLRVRGAQVTQIGANWNEADEVARSVLSNDPHAHYIPPFDDPLLWEGNSSLIHELDAADIVPDGIVLSVGGGGLLRGIQLGLKDLGWNDTKIFAVETEGAASFAAAKLEGKVVRLPQITSIATSLGALAVTPSVLDDSVETIPCVVSDREAVAGCLSIADNLRLMVEPACGASVAVVSQGSLRQHVLSHFSKDRRDNGLKLVVIVCGGSAINSTLLCKYKDMFNL